MFHKNRMRLAVLALVLAGLAIGLFVSLRATSSGEIANRFLVARVRATTEAESQLSRTQDDWDRVPADPRDEAATVLANDENSTVPVASDAPDPFVTLVVRLREVEHKEQDSTFYPAATEIAALIASLVAESVAKAGSQPDADPSREFEHRLLAAATDPLDTERMRSALVLAAGQASTVRLDSWVRMAAGNLNEQRLLRRAAVLGLGRLTSGSDDPAYNVHDYFRHTANRTETYRVSLARSAVAADTFDTLARIASSDDELVLRELCVLVLGEGLDQEERVRSYCLSLLDEGLRKRDNPWLAALFVLAHSRNPATINALLLRANPADGTPIGEVVRMEILGAIATHALSPDTLPALLSAANDPTLSGPSRSMLCVWLGDGVRGAAFDTGTGRATVLEHLHVAALTDSYDIARMAAFTALAAYPSADTLSTLESMLLHDEDPEVRADVAGLAAEISVDHAATFQVLLHAFDTETVTDVRVELLGAMIDMRGPNLAALLERVTRQDPDSTLGRMAAKAMIEMREK